MVWSSTRLGGDRRFFSTWSALGNPVFRKLWIAAIISGTCVAAHLLQKERMTKSEKELLQNAWSLHMGSTPPEERIYLCVSRELHTPRQCDYQPPGSPQKNLT
jgi:hypothetical protein